MSLFRSSFGGSRRKYHLARRLCVATIFCAGITQAPEPQAAPGLMGANKFDLLLQFTGRASGGDGSPAYLRITRAMGVKAILDGRDAGFAFFRFAAAGYGPSWPNDPVHNDLTLWQSDPQTYWSDVDRMFDELDQAGMRAVPSFLWNVMQFPALTGETVTQLIDDPTSKSRQLAEHYITEFVSRYKSRQTILFYEMGNEHNLGEDLDLVARCQKRYVALADKFCASTGNYSTDALIKFSNDILALLKKLDPTRGVSSGFATPRYDAVHLKHQPEYSPKGADWTADTAGEFHAFMDGISVPFPIQSLHIYSSSGPTALNVSKPSDIATAVANQLHPQRKQVFVGEFGDISNTDIAADISRLVADGTVDYAAIWVYEFYQSSLQQLTPPKEDQYHVEPGFREDELRALKTSLPPPDHDRAKPRIVLTWPLPCSDFDKPIDLSAVASIGVAIPQKVDFTIDGTSVGTADAFPFHVRFDPRPLGKKTATITASIAGSKQTGSSYSFRVRLNGAKDECSIE